MFPVSSCLYFVANLVILVMVPTVFWLLIWVRYLSDYKIFKWLQNVSQFLYLLRWITYLKSNSSFGNGDKNTSPFHLIRWHMQRSSKDITIIIWSDLLLLLHNIHRHFFPVGLSWMKNSQILGNRSYHDKFF